MELTQGMELAQVLKLSPGLLQSMEMLQMNTLELGAYLKELALENPVLEEAEPGRGRGRIRGRPLPARCPGWATLLGPDRLPRKGTGAGESRRRSPWRFCWRNSWPGGSVARIAGGVPVFAGLLDDDGRLDPEDLAGLRTAGVPAELLERGWRFSSPWSLRVWGPGVWRSVCCSSCGGCQGSIQWPKPSVRAIWRN